MRLWQYVILAALLAVCVFVTPPPLWLILVISGVSLLFWSHIYCLDEYFLIDRSWKLKRLSWKAFLKEFAFQQYIQNQTPFLSFTVSRDDRLYLHKGLIVLMSLGVILGVWLVFPYTALVLSCTPLFVVLRYLVLHDTVALYFAFSGILCCHWQQPGLGSILFGLAIITKYTLSWLTPYFIFLTGWWSPLLFAPCMLYYWWAYRQYFWKGHVYFLRKMVTEKKPYFEYGPKARAYLRKWGVLPVMTLPFKGYYLPQVAVWILPIFVVATSWTWLYFLGFMYFRFPLKYYSLLFLTLWPLQTFLH